ncbi:MAG TPA: enoyl-CoA hydratase/isomerase family protein [Polyangiaceae bacterium]|nr:enoyl-CoA hydratase/isomerase family protein [Polyangiaceae bacterium]
MSLRVERVGDAAVLTIDRPGVKNAIDRKLAKQLGDAVRIASSDPSVRGVVVTAAGEDTFISGGDLKELDTFSKDAEGGREVIAMFSDLEIFETCEVPVVAAVQGNVLGGGCELLLLCDYVIAEAHVALSFRHAKMGLSTAWGGMTRLVERVGPQEAARLLFTAEKVPAEEAHRIGLIGQVVPQGGSRAAAVARVNRIADNPRATVAALKRTLQKVREALRKGAVEQERATFEAMWGGADHQQAMAAFFTRRS